MKKLDKENYTAEEVQALINNSVSEVKNRVKDENDTHLANKLAETKQELESLRFKTEKLPVLKEAYKKAGGVEKAFNDFYKVNEKDLKEADNDKVNKLIAEQAKSKPHFFKPVKVTEQVLKGGAGTSTTLPKGLTRTSNGLTLNPFDRTEKKK